MKEKKKLLGYYNYTVVLTYIGMLFGFMGITFGMEGKMKETLLCLLLAGVCDMFDGAIASTRERTRSEKRFGIQIDSLSDLICFGLLPALVFYGLNGRSSLGFLAGGFYVLCALIRLAYFNIMEEERQDTEAGSRRTYLGLPVTTIALILPLGYLIQTSFFPGKEWIYIGIAFAAAFAFLLPFSIKKPYLPGKIGIALVGVLEVLFLICGAVLEV